MTGALAPEGARFAFLQPINQPAWPPSPAAEAPREQAEYGHQRFVSKHRAPEPRKGIEPGIVVGAVEEAIALATRKFYKTQENMRGELNKETGEITAYIYKTVVADAEQVEDPSTRSPSKRPMRWPPALKSAARSACIATPARWAASPRSSPSRSSSRRSVKPSATPSSRNTRTAKRKSSTPPSSASRART